MAGQRQTRRRRRAFGKRRIIIRHGRRYVEYSYPTPMWARERWGNLPTRCTKTVPPDREWEGESWLAQARTAIRTGMWEPPRMVEAQVRRETVTFAEYAESWLVSRRKPDGSPLKPTTVRKHREALDLYLNPVFGGKPMVAITVADVNAWWDGFAPVTARADGGRRRIAVYKVLAAIMRTASMEPDATGHTVIAVSPCRIRTGGVVAAHEPSRPTRDEFNLLLDGFTSPAMRMVARICDGAGLREGEALGLCLRHVDLERGMLRIDQQVQRVHDTTADTWNTMVLTPKTRGSSRIIPMPATLTRQLRQWVEDNHLTNPDTPLFTSPRTGTWYTPQAYRAAFNRARTKTGLERLRPHDLRKDCLSRMMEAGATVGEVMAQGGHTTMTVASKYQVVGEHLGEVMRRMDAQD